MCYKYQTGLFYNIVISASARGKSVKKVSSSSSMKFAANILRTVSFVVRGVGLLHGFNPICLVKNRCVSTSASLLIKRTTSLQNQKFSRKFRDHQLQKIRVLAMTDQATAAELAPLQAIVKEQVCETVAVSSCHHFYCSNIIELTTVISCIFLLKSPTTVLNFSNSVVFNIIN